MFFFPQKSKMNHRCGQHRIQFPSGQSQQLQGDNRKKNNKNKNTTTLFKHSRKPEGFFPGPLAGQPMQDFILLNSNYDHQDSVCIRIIQNKYIPGNRSLTSVLISFLNLWTIKVLRWGQLCYYQLSNSGGEHVTKMSVFLFLICHLNQDSITQLAENGGKPLTMRRNCKSCELTFSPQ